MSDKLSLWQVAQSVFASFFGVQSDANRRRDFEKGRASQFIIVGIILTLVFIASVWGGVQLLLLLL